MMKYIVIILLMSLSFFNGCYKGEIDWQDEDFKILDNIVNMQLNGKTQFNGKRIFSFVEHNASNLNISGYFMISSDCSVIKIKYSTTGVKRIMPMKNAYNWLYGGDVKWKLIENY